MNIDPSLTLPKKKGTFPNSFYEVSITKARERHHKTNIPYEYKCKNPKNSVPSSAAH